MRLDRLLTLYFFGPLTRKRRAKEGVRIPILMYHSISEKDEPGRHPYYQTNTRPDIFARHMQFLADNGYTVISLSTAVDLISGKSLSGSSLATKHKPQATAVSSQATSHKPLATGAQHPSPVTGHWSLVTEAPRYAVLTWDDGYRDFHDNAWPILTKHGFTATMFLPTGFIDNERNALNGKACLTWGEVKVLAADGAAFGAHTVSHAQLYELYKHNSSFLRRQESTHNELSLLRMRESTTADLSFLRKQESIDKLTCIEHELQASKREIEERLGCEVNHYSYAHAFPEQDQAFVNRYETSLRAAGYRAAVSTRIGIAMQGDNPYLLKRQPVNSHDDDAMLQAKLEGGYDWLGAIQVMKKRVKFAG